MNDQPNNQEHTTEPSSENTSNVKEQEVTPSARFSPDVTSPPDMPPNKKGKKVLIFIAILILLIAGGAGVWYFLNKDSGDEVTSADSAQETEESQPFNNVLYYAYYENGKTYVKSVDLDEQDPEKKTLLEFEEGGPSNDNPADGQYSPYTVAPISISKDGSSVLYPTKNGVYERNLSSDIRTSLLKFEWKKDAVGDEVLDKVIVTETGENIKDAENPETSFRTLLSPLYSYYKNAFGFTEGHYEGRSVDILDRDTNKLVDIGDTFRYIDEATAGDLTFTIKDEAKELVDYGLYTIELFDVSGGAIQYAAFNGPRDTVAGIVGVYSSVVGGVDYDGPRTLVAIDTKTGRHTEVKQIGKDSSQLTYRSDGALAVVDSNGDSYTLRQLNKDLKETSAKDLTKISGLTGKVVDVDLQLINDKIYVEITTEADKKFKTYVYKVDDDKVLTSFLVAEDSDLMVLKHE